MEYYDTLTVATKNLLKNYTFKSKEDLLKILSMVTTYVFCYPNKFSNDEKNGLRKDLKTLIEDKQDV